tara:strand:- start:235 stop:429 length:195 start_codon:yes stop_codon:yes gene_type:complete
MKTKKLNKIKKKFAKVFNTNPIEINLKFRINDRGEIVLVQFQSLDYDPMDILFRKTNYKEDMYE